MHKHVGHNIRMNRTFKSLLAKGIDSNVAQNIVDAELNLSTLSSCSLIELKELGVTNEIKDKIYDARPPIPDEIIDSLLYKSRRTCCVCRETERSIIIHHIIEWSESKSNEESNLVVLCLLHHDEAHSKKELSQNLTPERIKAAKTKWENEVLTLDKEILESDFKELEATTKQLFELKKKWFNFLKSVGMRVEILDDPTNKLKFDFRIYGKAILLVKVFEIDSIDELLNKEKLIQHFQSAHFLDSLIILGNKPFLSNDGFYGNETNIQIGWIYSFGEDNWDNVMLKEQYDISNSKFFIENLLYENTSYKNFLTDDYFGDVMGIWNK